MLNIQKVKTLVLGYVEVEVTTDNCASTVSFNTMAGYIIIKVKSDITHFTVYADEELSCNLNVKTLDELYDCLVYHAK